MLVALSGVAGSGKSTAAQWLVDRHRFVLSKFADPIKVMLKSLGLGDEHITGDLKEVPCDLLQGKTPRFAMQTLGTDWGRDMLGGGMWVDLWSKMAAESLGRYGRVVVDDCRFANEGLAVLALGGHVVRVEGRSSPIEGSHQSEMMDWSVPRSVDNSYDQARLYRSMDELVLELSA